MKHPHTGKPAGTCRICKQVYETQPKKGKGLGVITYHRSFDASQDKKEARGICRGSDKPPLKQKAAGKKRIHAKK